MTWPIGTEEDTIASRLKAELDEKRSESARLWKEFDDERKATIARRPNLSVDSPEFKQLEAKSAAYEAVAQKANDLRDRWERAVQGPGGRRGGAGESIGEEFLKRLGASQTGLKALDGTSGGTLVPPFFSSGIQELPTRQLFVRSIIPVIKATSDKVWFLRQSVATNAAAPVLPGGLKPQSTYTVERVEQAVRTIAHITEALDRALLSDFEELVSFIDGQLRLGSCSPRSRRSSTETVSVRTCSASCPRRGSARKHEAPTRRPTRSTRRSTSAGSHTSSPTLSCCTRRTGRRCGS